MLDIKQGDCLNLMQDLETNSIDMILTDIPYDMVNRPSNGLRVLDKGNADILTFDLEKFLVDITNCPSVIEIIFVEI